MTKRILAFLLALTMLLPLMPHRAQAAPLTEGSSGHAEPSGLPKDREKSGQPQNSRISVSSLEDLDPALLTAPFLKADTETTVALTPNTAAYFRFVPEATDVYTFFAVSDSDTFGIIEDGTESVYDDDSGDGNNFSVTQVLTAGTTYYLTACFYYASQSGSFTVTMSRQHQFSETVTTPATCQTEGLLTRVCDYCGLTQTEVLPSGHNWVDGECAVCGEVFQVSGTCGENLTWTLDGKGNLTVSGTGATYGYSPFDVLYGGFWWDIDESHYTAPPAPWAEYYQDIRTLTLEPGITELGYYVFWGLTGLNSVTVPEGVTAVDYGSFAYCTTLESITLPSTLQKMDICFEYCASLSEVTFLGPVPRASSQVLYPLPDGLTVFYSGSTGDWEWIREGWVLPANTTLFDIDSSTAPGTLSFAQDHYSLSAGQSLVLTTNADRYVQERLTQWQVSAPDIVYLSEDGHLTGLQPGTVEITLSSADGMYKAVCTVTVTGDEIPDSAFTPLDGTGKSNLGLQNYQVFDKVKTSFLSQRETGLERIQYISGTGVVIARYDSSFNLISEEILQPELSLFGGFFAGQDYNFLLYGQPNPTESNSTEVVRIVRYTRDWQRIDHCSILGANTSIPFDAGTADFAEQNGILYLHTSHEMYTSSDGLNHQANMTFAIDQQTMSVKDQWYGVMNLDYGYVSHSFSQRIRTNDRYVFRADHGDAYPRSLVLTRVALDGRLTQARNLSLLNIQGRTGDNYTGLSLGGLELSATNCLVVGNSVDQSDVQTWHPQNVRNIFLAVADQALLKCNVIWLTDYTEENYKSVSTPQLVAISEGLFLVLWEEQERGYGADVYTNALLVNGDGESLTKTVKLDCRLSDCQPIVTGSLVSWFTCHDPQIRLNQLSWRQLMTDSSGVEDSLSHDYTVVVTEPTCTMQGYTTYTCIVCGDSYTDSYVEPLGHIPDGGEIVYEPTCSHSGTKRISCERCGDSWLEDVPPVEHRYTTEVTAPTCIAQGYTIYSCPDCGDWRKDDYTEPLGHDLGDWEAGAPSNCVNPGYDVRRCSRCSFNERRDLPLGDHNYEVIVIDALCTEGGYTLYRCYHCRHEYTGDNTAPLDHDFGDWDIIDPSTCTEQGWAHRTCRRCRAEEHKDLPLADHSYSVFVTDPTCTEGGFTEYRCYCGAKKVDDRTDPLGHDFGAWYVTKAPTENAEGQEQRDCSRCRESETRSIPKADHVHSYTSAVTAPTCTEAGYTTYTCRCGDSYTANEVPPLGHNYGNGICSRCGGSDPDYQAPAENPFTDVKEGDFFYDSVLWAMGSGVTAGTSPTTFSPNTTCTRAQVVTFLWRSQGCPAPESRENPFTDVAPGSYYYDAVLWAVENNITAGTGKGLFSPDASCTRGQVVTFLWRTFGTPAPESDENPFTDVTGEAYFYAPVLWAVEQQITAGTGKGLFSPNAYCTRAQVVTFLFRAVK